jgi:O-antigen/teichoic acid export membrane protein
MTTRAVADSGPIDPAPVAESGTSRSLVSGGAFALGNVAQRVFAFLLLPVYTAALSPSQYGRLGLLVTVQGGVNIALSTGMETGVFRRYFYLEGDQSAQRRFIASAWKSLLVASPCLAAIISALLLLLVPTTAVFRPQEAAVAVFGAAVLVAATAVPLTILRAERRLRDYIVITLVAGVSTAVLTVLFVVVLHQGVIGYFVATLIANSLTFVVALFVVPWRGGEHFDSAGMRSTLRVALPLIPHTLSHWSLILLDRAMLAALVAVSALGVYTLASNLALPALILVLSLNQGFMPSYARAQSGTAAVKALRSSITAQVSLVFFICCAVALLAPIVVNIMAPSYSGASTLVPWLVLGYLFLGLYYVPMNAISLIVGRTTFVWIFSAFAAFVNLGLIYVLVPGDGLVAAAIASPAAYLVLFVSITLYSRKLSIRLSVDWLRTVGGAALFGVTYSVAAWLTPEHGMSGLAERCAAITLAVLLVGRLNGLRASSVADMFRGVVSSRASAVKA